jgi:type II secretory pathway component PulF
VLQRLLLSLPLIGGAHRRTAMMRFLGSLSMLLNAGVPVAEAYRTAAAATGNQALAHQLARETDSLYAGRGLVDTLNRLRLLPREAMDQMAIGETTGKLPQVLAHVAATHRGQVERSAKYLPHLLQLIAYAVIVPVALLLWFTLFNVFVHYRFIAPLDHLFDVP